MSARLGAGIGAVVVILCVLCAPVVALAEPISAGAAPTVSALSTGELIALIAIGFIPALVMIARERNRSWHHR